MSTPQSPELAKLSETETTLKDPNQDLRGRNVVDKHGDEVGEVNDLLIDTDERRVRFLLVGSGGFLGIGEDTIMLPVDAITRMNDDAIQVDLERNDVAKGPRYDRATVNEPGFWDSAYDHYGFLPFWAPGYRAPAWPGMP